MNKYSENIKQKDSCQRSKRPKKRRERSGKVGPADELHGRALIGPGGDTPLWNHGCIQFLSRAFFFFLCFSLSTFLCWLFILPYFVYFPNVLTIS
jgi:hypothetical protein